MPNIHMQAAWDKALEQHEVRAAAGRERAERDLHWQQNQFYDTAARLHGDISDDLEKVWVRSTLIHLGYTACCSLWYGREAVSYTHLTLPTKA